MIFEFIRINLSILKKFSILVLVGVKEIIKKSTKVESVKYKDNTWFIFY